MLGAQLLVDNKTSSIIIKIIIFFQSVESFFILIVNTFNFRDNVFWLKVPVSLTDKIIPTEVNFYFYLC